MSALTESEEAALAWLESLGYAIKHGPDVSLNISFGVGVAPLAGRGAVD